MIREAQPQDLNDLCDMASRFVAETELPLTYDPERTRNTFWVAINNPDVILLVDDVDGVLAGAVMGAVEEDEFCEESCAYLTKLYCEKEFRGLGGARALASAFDVAARNAGASIVFASSTAGMGERVETLYVRLFERIGYTVLGRVLVKQL